jgi:CRP-like cAMP-binding protein
MNANLLLYISRFVQLTPEEISIVDELFECRSFEKKKLLLKAGQVCDFECYVLKGCLRQYFIDQDNQEVTLEFATEDWWLSDIASFETKTKSRMFIEALEDAELLVLTKGKKDELLLRVPKLERMFRLMMQRHLTVIQNRLFDIISSTAMDRYVKFTTRYPTISQRVPQHYIASYLGITAEFLSKLRKRHLKSISS